MPSILFGVDLIKGNVGFISVRLGCRVVVEFQVGRACYLRSMRISGDEREGNGLMDVFAVKNPEIYMMFEKHV